MITRINNCSSQVSFGFAKLNSTGKKAADAFGIESNPFKESCFYRKQGLFVESALSQDLARGRQFSDICEEYGCTDIGKANAEFIQTQILSGKSDRAIQALPKRELKEGFVKLYISNYDNPDLSRKDTLRLLKMIKNYMAPELYIQNIGLLQEGTDK